MELNKYLADKLISLFFEAKTLDYAVNRLQNLCQKYNITLHFLNWDFSDCTIDEVDNLYLLILTI
jgi:hypothetical protein